MVGHSSFFFPLASWDSPNSASLGWCLVGCPQVFGSWRSSDVQISLDLAHREISTLKYFTHAFLRQHLQPDSFWVSYRFSLAVQHHVGNVFQRSELTQLAASAHSAALEESGIVTSNCRCLCRCWSLVKTSTPWPTLLAKTSEIFQIWCCFQEVKNKKLIFATRSCIDTHVQFSCRWFLQATKLVPTHPRSAGCSLCSMVLPPSRSVSHLARIRVGTHRDDCWR